MKNGILVIDKPVGFTSHDVIAKMRGICQMKRIGHAGTLDPMATGVLPLFFGPATKATGRMPNQDKAYLATMRLGIVTDTQDITGTVIEERPVDVTPNEVEQLLDEFTGKQTQLPPMYSAVQIDGKRLYQLARQGKTVERQPREFTVYEMSLKDSQPAKNEYTFYVSCSSGTYVRTLAHDMGERLGTGATLTILRRVYASGFTLENAFSIDQVQALADSGELSQQLIPVDRVFQEYPALELTRAQARYFLNGVPLWLTQFDIQAQDQWLRLYGPGQVFLGIARADREKRQLSNQQQFAGEVSF